MPTSVPEDFADTSGPNASLEFGQAGDLNRIAQHFTPGPAGLQQQLQAAQQGPGGPPGMASPGGPPGSPPGAPSGGPAAQPPPGGGGLNMSQVFPPMPQIAAAQQQPWRDQLRAFAAHPKAGPMLKLLARRIEHQRGPLEKQ